MKIVLWIIIFVILFIVWIRYIERRSIFFPMKDIFVTPESSGLAYEDIYIKTSDNKRLNGWYIPAGDAGPVVLFCHGNAGNISHRLEKISILRHLGESIFIFDYRGYGRSEGIPSEKGFYKDARAAYDYLTRERGISADNIILYGESIGGAVASDLALKVSVRGLITEELFTSIKDMAGIAYPFMPHFIFASRFDSESKMKHIRCPKLIIHSIDDEIVPFRLGEKLFAAASAPKRFLKIRGSHNSAFFDSKERFKEGIRSFFKFGALEKID